MKKRISLFLVFAMLITLIVPFTITTVSADTPTEITTKEELAAMSPSGNYVLANDVTISGTWDYSANQFTGTFDGNGHTIYIADDTTLKGGIFNQIGGGAVIKDLTVRQNGRATYQPGKEYEGGEQGTWSVGVLAGACRSNWDARQTARLIQNVTVYADVSVSNNTYNVGGLVGIVRCAKVVFDGCVFYGSVSNTGEANNLRGTAGIVGAASYYTNGLVIKNCINYGTISTSGNAGGIFGSQNETGSINDGGIGTITIDGNTYGDYGNQIYVIDGCVNYGAVTSGATYAGGIAAKVFNEGWRGFSANYNINYGAVTSTGSGSSVGGIVGIFSNGYKAEDPWMEVIGNVNYGKCTATNGTVLPIIVSSNKVLDGSSVNYCDTSTANGSGTNTPSVTVISDASAAVTALNGVRANAVVLGADGRIAAKWATDAGLVPVAISDQAGLAAMSPSGNYYLLNDITISGAWDYSGNCFTGTFDGRGNTISIADGASLKGGIFNQIGQWATVKDLMIRQLGKASYTVGTVTHDGSTSESKGVGVLAGAIEADGWQQWMYAKITNVTVYADVVITSNDRFLGGLVGYVRLGGARFDDCAFYGSVTGTMATNNDRGAGGILGGSYTYTCGIVFNRCINYGTITYGGQAGGIYGGQYHTEGVATSSPLTVKENAGLKVSYCVNYGAITGNAEGAGGIVGKGSVPSWHNLLITRCVNYGTVTNNKSGGYAGGIAGYINNPNYSEIYGHVNYGLVKADSGTVGTIVGYASKNPNNTNYNYCAYENATGSLNGTVISDVDTTLGSLEGSKAGAYVKADGKIALKWAVDAGLTAPAATITAIIGTQMSDIAESKRNIRFVAGIEDDLSKDAVGIEIQVFYGSECRIFEDSTTKVYTSIIADGSPVTAVSQGFAYLYTATLNNVPTDGSGSDKVIVLVRTFQLVGAEKTYSPVTAIVLNVGA